MITEALLAAILGSQWAIAQKMGVKADELGRSISQGMAQQIVAQHKGRLEVSSTPGRGSRFSIILPRE